MNKLKKKWVLIKGAGNSILANKGFTISYNPNTRSSALGSALDDLLHSLGGEDKNYTGEETAIVKEGKRKDYYILNGDFREEYEKLVHKGFDACYDFFLKMKEDKGSTMNN